MSQDCGAETCKSKTLTFNAKAPTTRHLLFSFATVSPRKTSTLRSMPSLRVAPFMQTMTNYRLTVFDSQVTAITELYLDSLQRWTCEVLLTHVSDQV